LTLASKESSIFSLSVLALEDHQHFYERMLLISGLNTDRQKPPAVMQHE